MPVREAAPLAVLLSIAVAAVVVAQDWRHIHWRSAAALLAATAFGIPLGLLLLTHARQELVKGGLGVLILMFAVYSLAARDAFRLEHEHRALLLLSGFLAGILGGAFGMNGPPLAIYGALRRWSPQHFRATLQAYFLPASVLGMIGYGSAGLWTGAVTREFLLSLPAMLPAVFLGRAINRRMGVQRFLLYVHGGLIVVGLVLLVQAVTG